MLKSILENRTYFIGGNHGAPSKKLKDFPSVVDVELWDTTSSGGDWSGFFVQKIGKNFYVIDFWQDGGKTLFTGKILASWRGEMMDILELMDLYESLSAW
jgi:hypothetical protein